MSKTIRQRVLELLAAEVEDGMTAFQLGQEIDDVDRPSENRLCAIRKALRTAVKRGQVKRRHAEGACFHNFTNGRITVYEIGKEEPWLGELPDGC